MKAEKAPKRDRDATERRILDAARDVLAAEGFQGFGVNAIARAAGCDKQLIYRYYGGIDGLTEALGDDIAGWWEERLRPVEALGRPASYAEMIQRLALCLLQALREDTLMQKILVWELTSDSPQVRRLSDSRSRAMGAWMMRTRGTMMPPDGIDALAFNALIVGGVQHMVLSAVTAGSFSGLRLETEEDWERVRSMLKQVISGLYKQAA